MSNELALANAIASVEMDRWRWKDFILVMKVMSCVGSILIMSLLGLSSLQKHLR